MNFIIPTPFGPIPIHFCQNEMAMIFMAITSFGGLWIWLKSKFKKKNSTCHHEGECCENRQEERKDS